MNQPTIDPKFLGVFHAASDGTFHIAMLAGQRSADDRLALAAVLAAPTPGYTTIRAAIWRHVGVGRARSTAAKNDAVAVRCAAQWAAMAAADASPGPWRADTDFRIVAAPINTVVAKVTPLPGDPDGRRRNANQFAIVRAMNRYPQMVAALRAIVNECGSDPLARGGPVSRIAAAALFDA